MEEVSTQKQMIEHYDRSKLYGEQPPLPTSIPERHPDNRKAPTHQYSTRMNHDHCVVTLLPTPVFLNVPPTHSPKQRLPHSSPAVSIISHSPPSTPPRSSPDSFNASTIPAGSSSSPNSFSYEPTSIPFLDEPSRFREFTPSPGSSFVRSSADSIIQKAAHHLQEDDGSLPQPHARTLRQSTTHQRKAELLYKARLPSDVTNFLSTKKSKNPKPHWLSYTH